MGALLILGLLALPTQNAFRVTPILSDDDQLLIALILTSLATMMIIIPKGHLTQVLSFSTISYALTIVFALFGGPDVALVTVLISSITTIFFFAIFTLFPTEVLEKQERHVDPTPVRRRQILTGLFVAGVTFLVVLSVLSQQPAQDTVAIRQIALAPYAHGKNVLTVILSDFRGLDTMGETTVVGLALLGILTLLTRGKGKLK
jgi:multicomponent Na+:H+ antiporter subunit A